MAQMGGCHKREGHSGSQMCSLKNDEFICIFNFCVLDLTTFHEGDESKNLDERIRTGVLMKRVIEKLESMSSFDISRFCRFSLCLLRFSVASYPNTKTCMRGEFDTM